MFATVLALHVAFKAASCIDYHSLTRKFEEANRKAAQVLIQAVLKQKSAISEQVRSTFEYCTVDIVLQLLTYSC